MLSPSKNNWISNNPFGIVIGLVLGILGCITVIDLPRNGGVGLIALYMLGALGIFTLLFSSALFQNIWQIPHILLLVLIGFFAGYLFDYLLMKMKRNGFLILIIVIGLLNTLAAYIVITLIAMD